MQTFLCCIAFYRLSCWRSASSLPSWAPSVCCVTKRKIILVLLTASIVWLQSQGQRAGETPNNADITFPWASSNNHKLVNHDGKSLSRRRGGGETIASNSANGAGSRDEWKWGGRGVWRWDTDLLVGVVTLARMVKLLLTVRRLANTWGGVWTVWEENQEAGERERDRKNTEEGGGWWGGQVHTGNYSHLQQWNTSHNVVPEQTGWQSCLQCACRKGGGKNGREADECVRFGLFVFI